MEHKCSKLNLNPLNHPTKIVHTSKGRRIFVPIASFFETSIAEGNEEAESPDTYQDTYMAWDILRKKFNCKTP